MFSPTKERMNFVFAKQIKQSGNPVLYWMIDDVCVRVDPAGNIKMDKAKSTKKNRWRCNAFLCDGTGESIYNSRELIFR